MPSRFEEQERGVEFGLRRHELNRHSPHESETFQKSQQVIVGSEAPWFCVDRCGFRKDLLFDGEVGIQIDLRGFDRFVSQPKCYQA